MIGASRYPKPAKRARKDRKPLRRKAKRKAKLHDADKLFSTYIRTRDGWACQRCGSPFHVQAAHLVSRRYRAVRFDPENCIALCSRDHVYFTHRPLEWEVWIEERFPGRLGMLKARALGGPVKLDYDALCDSLRLAAVLARGGK